VKPRRRMREERRKRNVIWFGRREGGREDMSAKEDTRVKPFPLYSLPPSLPPHLPSFAQPPSE